MPKLSIIIPTFNSAKTIERCLNSIRNQTFTDLEIVIQDGGSSDRTVELVREFERENPSVRIELKQEPDAGAYDAMNKGMRRAAGEWLYFLGSDDELYDKDVLAKLFSGRRSAFCDVIYGNAQMIGTVNTIADGAIYDGPFDLTKLLFKNICHQAIFYRAAFAREVGFYNHEYRVLADWDFNMRCWVKGRFKYVNLIVAKFHTGGLSTDQQPDSKFYADQPANIARYFGKRAEEARRETRFAPKRVARALARRLGIAH